MSATIRRPWQVGALFLALSATSITTAHGQTTAFTYQGQLSDAGTPANANYDLRFALFDSAMGGTQIGTNQTVPAVQVSNGLFTVQLDFGVNAFPGASRFVEIGVSPAGGGSFTTLAPRQQISSSPYSIRTLSAATADTATNAAQLGGVAASQYVQTSDSRLSDARLPTAGSANYIQNATSQQTASFNISGNGTVGGNLIANGDVGIGTSAPTEKFVVQTATHHYGFIHTDGAITVGSYVGSTPNGGWYGTKSKHPLSFFTNNGGASMTIGTDGNVGIGTTSPFARLEVVGPDTSFNTIPFRVVNSADFQAFAVADNGAIGFGTLNGSSTTHACYKDLYSFAACSSAAEYVPTIDGNAGFPETADLVSIAPAVANPYGDAHGPFTVQKSSTACDTNLLGFIVNPESGADGTKLNDHYLPLAIYGYFPAKVTMENGAIKRGDPITSSSTPGYGMKATGACKTIGYALEDADREGTIQVFAQHGENAAPEVAALRTQMQDLRQANEELRQANAVLAARLETLEAPNRLLAARLTALEEALQERSRSGSVRLSSLADD